MDYLNDLKGHDALIEGIAVDVPGKCVSIRLLAYPNEKSKTRKSIEFIFRDVKSMTASADLDLLADNSSAGTVNHWHLAQGPGTSFFYLIEGYIAIAARSAPKLEERASP